MSYLQHCLSPSNFDGYLWSHATLSYLCWCGSAITHMLFCSITVLVPARRLYHWTVFESTAKSEVLFIMRCQDSRSISSTGRPPALRPCNDRDEVDWTNTLLVFSIKQTSKPRSFSVPFSVLLRPKTKIWFSFTAENETGRKSHLLKIRCRKRKRNSVGLYPQPFNCWYSALDHTVTVNSDKEKIIE